MRKTKRNWLYAAVASAALLAAPITSQAQSNTELMVGNNSSTLDTKVIGHLAPKTGFFARTRVTSDYEGNTNHFSLADLTYSLGNGIDAVFEVQAAPEMGVVPRIGVQYYNKLGNLSAFALVTASTSDAEIISLLRYQNGKGSVQAETVTNIGNQGHNFSLQRLRAGLSIGDFEFGVAVDLTESGTTHVNAGIYLTKRF